MAKEILKNGKAKRIKKSQHDEAMGGAGAVGYTDEEMQEIITSNLQQRILDQTDMRKLWLAISYSYIEHEELIKIVDDYDKYPADQLPRWYGIPMSNNLLKAEINCKTFDLKIMMSQLNNKQQNLINRGFTKEQIEDIKKNGLIIKDLKQLEKMENDHRNKQIEKQQYD